MNLLTCVSQPLHETSLNTPLVCIFLMNSLIVAERIGDSDQSLMTDARHPCLPESRSVVRERRTWNASLNRSVRRPTGT